jgi:hypothetical protein
MSESYLLNCECGKRTPVGPSQAGRTVRCACGATLDVPALRALRRLPVADAAAAEEQPAWSLRQQLWVVGAMFILTAAILGGILRWKRPPSPDEEIRLEVIESAEAFRRQVPHYTVAQVRESFEQLQSTDLRMLGNVLDQHPYHAQYKQLLATNRNWTIVAWSLAGIGILIIAATHVFAAVTPAAKQHAMQRGGAAKSRKP